MELEKTVTEHAVTLGILVNSMTEIKGFMQQFLDSQKKQEVLMERLANFEGNTKTSFDRVHSRIDKQDTDIGKLIASLKQDVEERNTEHEDECETIKSKAHDGFVAFSIIIWAGRIMGAIMVTYFMWKVFGIGGIK